MTEQTTRSPKTQLAAASERLSRAHEALDAEDSELAALVAEHLRGVETLETMLAEEGTDDPKWSGDY